MADANDCLKAMKINEIIEMQTESHAINQMIDQATDKLAEKAKHFNRTEIFGGQEISVATQNKFDAMVSNIPTSTLLL